MLIPCNRPTLNVVLLMLYERRNRHFSYHFSSLSSLKQPKDGTTLNMPAPFYVRYISNERVTNTASPSNFGKIKCTFYIGHYINDGNHVIIHTFKINLAASLVDRPGFSYSKLYWIIKMHIYYDFDILFIRVLLFTSVVPNIDQIMH